MMSNNNLPEEMGASVAGQISQLVQTGLPIETGLRALAEQSPSLKIKSGLIEICRCLEQGMPLESALQSSGVELPDSLKALVGAGIKSGRMDSVMLYSIEQAQRAVFLREQIWLALSYPIFLFWFSALYCGAFLIFIIPYFTSIFHDFGTELPGMTMILIRMASLMNIGGLGEKSWAVIFLIGLILSLVAVLAGFSNWMQTRATSIPLLGRIFQFAALSDFCQLLALLVESGLPFSKSLQITGNASDDRWLNLKCQSIAEDIETGTTPEVAARNAGFPGTIVQVFHNTNSQHSMVDTLRGLSDIYAAQCSLASRLASSLIGPFTVIFVTFFVGFTVIGLFMPLIKLLNDLS